MKILRVLAVVLPLLWPSVCYPAGQMVLDQARDIETDTSTFDNNLSVADSTVQTALETIDNMSVGTGSQSPWTTNINGAGRTLTNVSNIGIGRSTVGNAALAVVGNIGIGTTDPGGSLNIQTGGFWEIYFTGASNADIYSGTVPMYITSNNQDINIGPTGTGASDFVVKATSGKAIAKNSLGVGTTLSIASSLLIVGTHPDTALVVMANGNTGIGRTNPVYKLQVSGTFDASTITQNGLAIGGGTVTVDNITVNTNAAGALQLKAGTGTSGQMILSNGSGLVWANTSPAGSGSASLTGTTNGILTLTNATTATGSSLNIIDAQGNVGIGYTLPVGVLQVGSSPTPGLIVLNNGNVGVGTTAPVYRVQIAGTLDATTITQGGAAIGGGGGASLAGTVGGMVYLGTANSGTGSALMFTDGSNLSLGTNTAPNQATLYIKGNSGTSFPLRIASSAPTDALVVDQGARVGIGTTAPLGLLQVGSQTAPGLFVTTQGLVGIGNTVPAHLLHVGIPAGTAPYPGLIVSTNNRVGIGTTATPIGVFQVGTAPTPGLMVTWGGHVAIGVTSAGCTLDVRGENTANVGQFRVMGFGSSVEGRLSVYDSNAQERGEISDDATNFYVSSGISRDMKLMTNAAGTDGIHLRVTGNVGIGTTLPNAKLEIVGTGGISTTGNFGIGKTNPTVALDVVGEVKISDVDTGGTEVGTALYIGSDGKLCTTGHCN